jgi:hypothetical protein
MKNATELRYMPTGTFFHSAAAVASSGPISAESK